MKNKKLFWGIFLAIMLVGIFLRTWHHSEWLYFKWDQGRDADLLAPAVENGPSELPLLGPRATKVNQDYLHLGPAYYYFQYLPAALLHSTEPTAFAYFDLIMAILTIPLLFVFCRLYFSERHSLIIAGLYAVSFLVVQYSRFAWNPNSVPFLMLLTFYGILRFAEAKKNKDQIKWLALWALGFSLASQFHFYAFFALVGISGIFFIYHFNLFKFKELPENLKKVFSKSLLKTFGVALGVIALTYVPMIVSEIKTDCSNSKLFFGAFGEKARDDKTFSQKIIRNFREHSEHYFLLTTSFDHRDGNKNDPIPITFGLLMIATGIYLSIYFYRKEKSIKRKNFLFLLPIWIVFFFLLTITTSYGLRPRYFVPIFPVPFIIVGLFLVSVDKKLPKQSTLITALIVIVIACLNLYGIKDWFTNNALSQNKAIDTYRNYILQKDDGITLGQFKRSANYILENTSKDTNHVLIWTKTEYKQPLQYILNKENPGINWDFVSKEKELYGQEGLFGLNTVNGGFDSISKDVKEHVILESEEQFGQILMMKLKIDYETKNIPPSPPKIVNPDADGGKTERLFWKDIL